MIKHVQVYKVAMRVFDTFIKKFQHHLHNDDSQFWHGRICPGNNMVIKMKSRGSSRLVESLLILLRTETEIDRQTNMILRMINVHIFTHSYLCGLCVILGQLYVLF